MPKKRGGRGRLEGGMLARRGGGLSGSARGKKKLRSKGIEALSSPSRFQGVVLSGTLDRENWLTERRGKAKAAHREPRESFLIGKPAS